MWRIFLPHEFSLKKTKEISQNKGRNALVTGYPACDIFMDKNLKSKSVWKKQNKDKVKIIWAPHHTIENNSELNLSSFLTYANLFIQLTKKFSEEVQWSFKPHPMLKQKLYNHHQWGENKTIEYYEYWEKGENTQLNLGEYELLFVDSDAMIHDCGSFLVEYLYLKKPVSYLMSQNTIANLNKYGIDALEACNKVYNKEEIENFIIGLINKSIKITEKHYEFYNKKLLPYYDDKLPSEKIVGILKQNLKGEKKNG
jgi:CDP-glycerol glycerophosphotransferase (TagB/SpsB family)